MKQETKDKIKETKQKKKAKIIAPVSEKKYKLIISGDEKNPWDFITPMRKSLRKNGQYLLLHRIESMLTTCKTLIDAKDILGNYFIFSIKEK